MGWLLCLGAAASIVVTGAVCRGWEALWVWPVSFLGCTLALALGYWLFLAVVSLGVNLKKPYARPSGGYYRLLNSGYRFLCDGARVKVTVTGLEKLPQGNFLLVSNHRSRFDHMIQSVALGKRTIAYISKPENFKVPIGRRYIHRAGYLPIDRNNPRNALITIQAAAERIRSGASSVGVFPEGHRGDGRALLPFHSGCLKAAVLAGCPVVAVAMEGTEHIHENFPWRRTNVTMTVVSVHDTAGVRTPELARMLRGEIEDALKDRKEAAV